MSSRQPRSDAGGRRPLDISPELVELARRRLPRWADRIWVGNAAEWMPSRRFDVARTGLDYVPSDRRRALVERLLSYCDRVVIGVHNEARGGFGYEEDVAAWGLSVAGRSTRPHPHPQLEYKAFWLNA